MADPAASRIRGFELSVRDPDTSARFYCEGLGFTDAGPEGRDRRVRLGDVEVRLAHAPDGGPPPAPASANAPDFQHFAIRVGDMAAACAQLSAFAPAPISHGGPQRLPPQNGSVTAWKFRDPDGHPLELLQFPGGGGDGDALFERIDHTALACADLEASLAFYAGLGFTQGPSSHNRGPAQDELDGLSHVDLRIATAHLPGAGPHIELLHYLQPPPPTRRTAAPGAPFVRTQLLAQGPAAERRDPDGHLLDLY